MMCYDFRIKGYHLMLHVTVITLLNIIIICYRAFLVDTSELVSNQGEFELRISISAVVTRSVTLIDSSYILGILSFVMIYKLS